MIDYFQTSQSDGDLNMTTQNEQTEEEEYTSPPVDCSCHLCRSYPCRCEELLQSLKAGRYVLEEEEGEEEENEEYCYRCRCSPCDCFEQRSLREDFKSDRYDD